MNQHHAEGATVRGQPMNFRMAIGIDGSERLLVSAYHLQAGADRKFRRRLEAFSHCLAGKVEFFELTQPEEQIQCLLIETEVVDLVDFTANASAHLINVHFNNTSSACYLMFDGVYGDVASLIEGDDSENIYGCSSVSSGPALLFDRELMYTSAWKNLVSHCWPSEH